MRTDFYSDYFLGRFRDVFLGNDTEAFIRFCVEYELLPFQVEELALDLGLIKNEVSLNG